MNIISGTLSTASDAPSGPAQGLRYRVLSGNQAQYLARDAYDRDDTLYVVAQDWQGQSAGSVRLLPTTGPYALGADGAAWLQGAAAPCAPEVWELSRFEAPDFTRRSSATIPAISADGAIGLLREAAACARAHGARRLLLSAPLGLERLLQRAGLRAHRAAPPAIVDGAPVCVCWIELEA